MPLYLVRHGRTLWNSQGRYQGQQDSPLLPEGIAQAHAAASYLADKGIVALYHSPLGRARETAQIVSDALGVAPHAEDRLMECGYGICEGMGDKDIKKRHPSLWAWREADKWGRKYPEGESYQEVSERLKSFFDELSRDEPLCIVSHRGISRALAGLYLGWSGQQVLACNQDNGEIFILEADRLEVIRTLEERPSSP